MELDWHRPAEMGRRPPQPRPRPVKTRNRQNAELSSAGRGESRPTNQTPPRDPLRGLLSFQRCNQQSFVACRVNSTATTTTTTTTTAAIIYSFFFFVFLSLSLFRANLRFEKQKEKEKEKEIKKERKRKLPRWQPITSVLIGPRL